MEKPGAMRLLIFLFFLIFLIFPYLIFLPKISYFTFIDQKEFFIAFANTAAQSAFSATACLIVGFLGGLSLLSVPHRRIKTIYLILLIPTFLPTLYIILSVLSLWNPFPFGLMGIVLIHTIIFSGLTAILSYELLDSKTSGFSELALSEGASRIRFTWTIFKFLKKDFSYIFLSLFMVFFSSFSVPLMVGKNTLILETLIFEKIKIFGEYGHALAFTLFESVFLLGLAFFLKKSEKSEATNFNRNMSLLSIPYFYRVLVISSWILLLAPVFAISFKFEYSELAQFLFSQNEYLEKIKLMTFNTGWTGLGTAFFVYVLSLVAIYISDSHTFRKAMFMYVVPSTALVGFALLILDLKFLGLAEKPIKLIFGLSFLFLPSLYRFRIIGKFEEIMPQLDIAKTMGASSFLNFFKITLPQVHRAICFVAGLSGFWAASDFALSQFIFSKDDTWSLFIYSLMNGYHLERASIFIFMPLFIGILVFIFFQGFHYVIYPKRR